MSRKENIQEQFDLFMTTNKHNMQEVLHKVIGFAKEFDFLDVNKYICLPPLLGIFKHVCQTYLDEFTFPKHSTLKPIQSSASGFHDKLKVALRCLCFLNGSDPDIIIACSELPFSATGSEFFGALEVEISQLLEPKEKETKTETDHRCVAIIDHIDLYCYLASLREFAFYYTVILCAINGKSKNIANGYLEVAKMHRSNMEAKLRIIFEIKCKGARVGVLFREKGDWPMLKTHIELLLESVTQQDKYKLPREQTKSPECLKRFENSLFFVIRLFDKHNLTI